jgi:phage terminase small subunit
MALNPKQQRFVAEYLVDLNATQAAIRAGYSEKTAASQAFDLLRKPEIAEAVQQGVAAQQKRTEITSDYVLSSIREVAERCMQRAPVMVKVDGEWVQETDEEGRHVWQFNAAGANKALELLGKHLGLFTDKVQHSGPDVKPIPFAMVVEFVKAPDGSAR